MNNDPILIETEIFNYREVKPHFINECCFGEDFAAWLREELIRKLGTEYQLSHIIQEDWGWGFWARKGKDPFGIGVGHVSDDRQKSPARWIIFWDCDYGLNLFKRIFYSFDEAALAHLQVKVGEVLESNAAIRVIRV